MIAGTASPPSTNRARAALRRVTIAGTVALVSLLAGSASAASGAWFRQAYDIATTTPATTKCGEPSTTTQPRNKGGEAAAVFDVNRDRVPDIVIVNGSSYYFVALGHKNRKGSVSYPARATPHPVGVAGDRRIEHVKALGLSDFNRDGRLDLYFSNSGDGTLALNDPRNLADTTGPNLDSSALCQDHRYRTYVNNGDGTFRYRNLGADVNGVTRTPLFADFDGNGRQDMLALNAPYYGIWWGNSPAPSSLLPGRANGTFAGDVLKTAVVDKRGKPESHLFENRYGQGTVDIKGAVVRDFDGDAKPDVLAAAYSDVWDGIQTPPLAPADPAGANVDLNHDGVPDGGYQGAWPHGILALENISRRGHIRFRDESASATNEGLGHGNRMDAYEVIPVDLDHDGRLDIVAIGIRNFTGFDSLRHQTPIIEVYRNASKPGHLRFVNVTKNSGLQFMNRPAALKAATHGLYPITIPSFMFGGGPLVLEPNLSAGAAIDLNNSGRPDLVLVDRQFTSTNPLTGREFAPWVFKNLGNFRFKWIPPAKSGLTHTAREITYGELTGNGREDIVTVNGSGGGQTVDDDNYVWRNNIANSNHWVDVRIRSASNPLGLGAQVTVYRAGTKHILGDDELRTDFGYRSRRDAVLHFGLGKVGCVDIRIKGLGRPVTVSGIRADRTMSIALPRARHARRRPGCS